MDNDRLTSQLLQIGLSHAEAKLYITLHHLGPLGATELARHTGIQRSNVYYFLDALREKGLASEYQGETGIKYFQADPPERFLTYLESQKKKFESQKATVSKILPQLKKRPAGYTLLHPQVRLYESLSGIRMFYAAVFKSKKFCALADIAVISAHFPDYTWGLLKIPDLEARELVIDNPAGKKYQRQNTNPLHLIKLLPKSCQFTADIVLYEKRVAQISYQKIITAFSGEDPKIFEAQQAIFDTLWAQIK